MQRPLPQEIRRLLDTSPTSTTPDLVRLAYDNNAVCHTVDVLDALLGGVPFFVVVQLLDGLAETGVVRPEVDRVAHLLGTVCCAENELKELLEALCMITEHGVKLAA